MSRLNLSCIRGLKYIVSVNFLAHAYLSFEHPEALVGNMISDFVKGKKKYDYSPAILAGINLHRAIDAFTDDHPVTKAARNIFKPVYGRYSAAFMDVAYDHFLGRELAQRGAESFKAFTRNVYRQLDVFEPVFPGPFKDMYPYMKQQDWLFNYQFIWGMVTSFEGLTRRAAYISDSRPAVRVFEENYAALESWYGEFFPSLKAFSLDTFHKELEEAKL